MLLDATGIGASSSAGGTECSGEALYSLRLELGE